MLLLLTTTSALTDANFAQSLAPLPTLALPIIIADVFSLFLCCPRRSLLLYSLWTPSLLVAAVVLAFDFTIAQIVFDDKEALQHLLDLALASSCCCSLVDIAFATILLLSLFLL